jgi:hypothetical protein
MILVSAAQSFFAIATILFAGHSTLRLVAPSAQTEPLAERIGLSWLLGAGWISVMIAALGTMLNGVALICGVLASVIIVALVARRRNTVEATAKAGPLRIWEWLLLAVITTEVVAIAIAASRVALGWDALMIWEWKSRLAFLNGGSLPAAYFSNPMNDWSLPRYPLQLPYVGSWLYLCLGRFDQAWVRIIDPLYYLAGACIVAGACQRIHGSRFLGLCCAAALFFVPYIFAGTWGVFAGYADLPLAVLFVATISRIPSLTEKSNAADATILGVLAALLPWMKREGQHLWVIAMLLTVVQLWQVKAWRRLPWVIGPGALLIAIFELSMAAVHALPYHDAVGVSFNQLGERMGRLGIVTKRLFAETLDFNAWGLLWPGAIAAVIALVLRRQYRLATIFGGALGLCWLLLGSVYFVGFPTEFEALIGVTIDRIVLQFVPLAVLTIALAIPHVPSKTKN